MTKSQLAIRLSSKKLDRRVSPMRFRPQTYRFKYLESPRKTFIRAKQYTESVLNSAVYDCGEDTGSHWTSTHLVTLEVIVTDHDVSHSSVTQQTLNGSQLVLLTRYLARFADEVARRTEEKRSSWPLFNYQWCPIVTNRTARAVGEYFGAYE